MSANANANANANADNGETHNLSESRTWHAMSLRKLFFMQLPLDLYRQSPGAALRNATIFEFPFGQIDRLGAPLWNVILLAEDGALNDGFGYGPTLERAQTSAWGEAIEWFHARDALKETPILYGSYVEVKHLGKNALDPISLNLQAGTNYTPAKPLQWVEIARHPDGETVLVPIEFVAPRYADIAATSPASQFVSVPITNGLGAGPTFERALAHGVLELLQRDGNSVSYRALDRGVRVELDEVRDPQTRALLDHLEREGVEILVKVAATDFGMANVYVVGYDRELERAPLPIALSACGEAVHPDREIALGKALHEFCMARARKTFNHGPLGPIRALAPDGYLRAFRPATMRSEDDRALNQMRDWMSLSHQQFFEMLRDPIFTVRETVKFSELPTTQIHNDAQLLQLLTERLNAENLEIYYSQFTPKDAAVCVLKAIVPGLEVETMTYQRIGARNLARLLERDSPLVGLGNAPATSRPIALNAQNQARFPGAWFDGAQLDAIIGDLYPLYREPGRHVLGFMEETPFRQDEQDLRDGTG